MKKTLFFTFIALTFIFVSFGFIDNVSATTLFDTFDNKYYIVHKWVGNNDNTGNNAYYVGVFNNKPTISNYKIYDENENIVYYKITRYDKLVNFMETGDISYVDSTTTTKNSMMLNSNSQYMLYSNFDLYVDSILYFVKNEYIEGSLNTEEFHFDFENNSCDDSKTFCLDELGTLQYSNSYVTSGNKSVYLENLQNTTSPNGFSFNYWDLVESTEFISKYLYVEFDFYRSENALEYSKLFNIRRYDSGGANNNLEIKEDGACYGLATSDCWYENNINHIIVEINNGYIYITITDNINTKYFEYGITENKCIRSFDFGFSRTYSGDMDDSPFTGYIDNLTIRTVEKDEPEITITKTNETIEQDYITDVTLNIDFSIIDNDSYLYMYKYGSDSEWSTVTLMSSTSFSKTYSENNTLYVQVIDRNSQEVVTTSTYTIFSIFNNVSSNNKVSIYFQKITEDVDSELFNQCTIAQGTVSYRACETFSISFDVINYNKYIYEMSLDGGITWEDVSTRLYNNFFLERIFENKTIYIRVLNRSDYSVNNSATFQVSTIESTSELGQKVLFSSGYYIQSPDIEVTALFLNYDSTNYNYYYSLYNTSESFIDITDSIECTNNLCTFKTRIYVKGTMYVRIEDKSGNLIYTGTYTVDYYNWMNTNNPFDKDDFFDTFFSAFDYFLNPIKEIFNSISIFFDSLPIEIKYTFYVSFVIIIILFLIKFIL